MKNRIFNIFTLFALLLSLAGSAASVSPAYATGIVVNTAVDENNTGSDCSLREAITAANTDSAFGGCPAGSGDDAITFAGNYTITLSSQLPVITTVISITGNGAANSIIQANANPGVATYRIFEINFPGELTLNSLTVRHGRCASSCATLISYGGGILNLNSLTITNSDISNNSADTGGGVYNLTAALTVTNSTFSGNSAPSGGGGIYNAGGTAIITNSTISTNSASSGNGGGILNISGTAMTLLNTTLSGNSGGGITNNDSTLNLTNTIIANSTSGGDCTNSSGTIGTSANNLIEATASNACGLTNGSNGNIIGSDPFLGSLADNGGPTQTHALTTSSPAINTGTNTGCPSTDQRGLTRPQFLVCDIGAVESNTQQDSTLVVNTNEDSNDGFCDAFVSGVTDCTLREAINYANGVAGTWTINFASNYTITLSSSLPDVMGTIILNGNGVTDTIIQANAAPNTANYRVFSVNGGNLTLNQLTVRHGVCDGLCSPAGGTGGGIYISSGTLAINNSLVTANNSTDGGAGLYSSFGEVTIKNSTFSDNIASNAGGAITNQNTMTISNSTIANNTASGFNYAGGIRNLGTLNIFNSTISNNTSSSLSTDGANVVQDSGTLNLYNTIIANGIIGGDCAINAGTVNATNTLIESSGSLACNNLANGSNGNIIGSDPNLGSLTGSPAYFPLNTGSPAIDAGDNTVCAATPVNNTSQNGVTRPEGSACDIGSFEFDYSPNVSAIVRASTSPTSAASVNFTVTFSESVQNVDTGDFTLTTTGVTGASVTSITPVSASVYTVSVNTGSGSGTLRLDVNSATIEDLSGNPLSGLPFTSGEEYIKTLSLTYKSAPANDGWILESSETSNSGGTMNSAATTITLGDDAADRQYRAIMHFDTSSLPDTAVVTNMTLKIKQQGNVVGVSPFSFASLYVDMRNPAFGGSALELADFNFAAKKVKSAVFNPNPVSGWFSARFNNGGNLYVNRTGVTQLRLYFSVDDNNNNVADFIRFFSGNASAGDRPKLLITYYLP
jgi:CSLREA domain-containing protein